VSLKSSASGRLCLFRAAGIVTLRQLRASFCIFSEMSPFKPNSLTHA
jgi:hypothetical protein